MAMRMQRRCAQQVLAPFTRTIWILSVVLASLLTGRASADNGHEVALARALFEEGVALGDQGDWNGAADRFQRAYTLKPTPGIAFNWASALSEVGKLTQASELLETVSRDPKATPELRSDSELKLAQIGPRRARLTLHVDASIDAESQVSVDGKAWPHAVWDVAIPVDPGVHVATASDGERQLARAQISLAEGESGELGLGTRAPSAASAQTRADDRHEQAAAGQRPPLYKSWILWTCVGAVVVGGVALTAVLATRDGGSEAPVAGNAGAGVIRW